MKIFLDTADIEEIKVAARWGVLDGVTTNPSLYAKVGGSYEDILRQICRLTPGPVSAEVVASDVDGMLREGRAFAKLARNIVVKVPMSEEGLEAIARFAEEGIKTNCTLIFSANQGLLAAKAGASLISPFVGRLDDINQDGMTVIRELAEILSLHEIDSEIISASIRNPLHVTQSALAGAHIATIPFKILQQMVHHPLTDKGIETFRSDWEKARAAVAAKAQGADQAAAELAETPASAAALAVATGTASSDGNANNGKAAKASAAKSSGRSRSSKR
jgi:transaldolase